MTVAAVKRPNDPHRFRLIRGQQADLELRTVICGVCGAASPLIDGPTGRAWWRNHSCRSAA